MYSQRTRNIIIGSILTVVILLVCICLTITLYITTDLFKSNETLFYKYALQTLDSLKYVQSSQLAEIEKMKEEKAYEVDGKLSYTYTDLNKNSANSNIKLQLSANNPEKEAYANLDVIHNTKSIFNLQYAKSNNIVALKSPEIVNAYLGVKNENLQEIAKKLGVKNTSMIPDSIKQIKLNEFFNITDEQKNYLKETYLKVLQENIDKSKFIREKGLVVNKDGESYNTTAYHLSLTNEELKQVEIVLLQTLKEDDTTLGIIKEKLEMLGYNNIEINSLKSIIQNQINKINYSDVNSDNSGINIMLYATGGRIITTEIIYNNSIKFTLYGTSSKSESRRYLLIENLNLDTEFQKIEIFENEIRNKSELSYNAIVNINDKTQIKANLSNERSDVENKLISNYKIEIEKQDDTQTINYTGETKFDSNSSKTYFQLNKTNCGILNDYKENQLKTLVQAVLEKTNQVINQKLQIIGINTNKNNNNTNMEVQ